MKKLWFWFKDLLQPAPKLAIDPEPFVCPMCGAGRGSEQWSLCITQNDGCGYGKVA